MGFLSNLFGGGQANDGTEEAAYAHLVSSHDSAMAWTLDVANRIRAEGWTDNALQEFLVSEGVEGDAYRTLMRYLGE